MSDEITRVARAIAERVLISSRHPWPAPDHPDWIDLACAAIDAMTSRLCPSEIERLRARVEVLERVRKAAVRMIRRMPKGCWCIREQEGLIDALAESRKQANIKAYL